MSKKGNPGETPILSGLALSSGKQDLIIDPPLMNSAGTLGWALDPRLPFELAGLGAFVTHPTSYRPRFPARSTQVIEYPGGMLLHTGLPNPGLSTILRENKRSWESSKTPIILHLLAEDHRSILSCLERLDQINSPVQALELACERHNERSLEQVLDSAIQSQLPILARIGLDTPLEHIQAITNSGANALVLGPPRGTAYGELGDPVQGRLYGPSLFPQALHKLETCSQTLNLPIILGCGLFTIEQVWAAFSLGAAAVQLDTILWVDPEPILSEFTKRKNRAGS
jgi:dihydroorotate dehydrogenase (NAD+) catalytic subunit